MTSKRSLNLLVLVAVLFSALAIGAVARSRAIPHISPESFDNLIIGDPLVGQCAIDYSILGGTATGSVSPCRESSCAVQSAAIGDTCLASTTYGANDGGTVLPAEAQLGCKVTVAGTALIQLCFNSTDAGSFDPGAGLFKARVIH